MKPLSFHSWVKCKIAPPLLGVGLILLISQSAILIYAQYIMGKQQSDLMIRLINVGREAVFNNQSRLLEQVAAIAKDEVRMEIAILCGNKNNVIWSYPHIANRCELGKKPGYKVVIAPLFSTQPYPKFLVQFPKWPPISILAILLATTLSIILGGIYLLWRIRFQIHKDLYVPISCISDPKCLFSISELEAVRINLNTLRKHEKEHASLVAIGSIATRVAHDLRSPLSSLQAAGRMLKEYVDNNVEAVEVLNMLQLSGKRLEDITNDLLNRNKESGCSQKTFSIHLVLDELVGELKSSPLGAGTEFKKNYHDSALYVAGDKTGISRAIGNIIKNALEAMQDNPIDRPRQLIISTLCHGDSSPEPALNEANGTQNDKIVIRITDTGPGIPSDKIPLILQGGHTEGKSDGHGIGTSVVREMMEAHGGKIAIESEVGVGTAFILTLPSADAASIPHDAATVTIPHSANGIICVIDDEASMREQWRLTLRTLGIEARLFGCWEEFVACHPEAHSPCSGQAPPKDLNDTFIVDYQFNNSTVDGLEVIRRLKEQGHTQFVLATAEYWKPAVKDAALKLGVTLCPKPLPRVVLALCHPEAHSLRSGQVPPKDLKLGDSSVAEFTLSKAEGLPQNDKLPNVLVIDDDDSIRMCWKVQRKSFGIGDLLIFASMEECETNRPDYSRIDLAFIDKHIEKSAWKLDQLIVHLKQNGVCKVWIASGETVQDLQNDPACASADGIVKGKMPESIDPYIG